MASFNDSSTRSSHQTCTKPHGPSGSGKRSSVTMARRSTTPSSTSRTGARTSSSSPIIAGHGRLAAARKLGLAEVPVIALRGLTETQKRQLMLADNRIALNAGWDVELLNLELKELSVLGADLELLGFTAKELAAALNPISEGLTDEDEVPEVGETAVTRPGDVW